MCFFNISQQKGMTHKRVAVPYEAADMPSLRSEYAHPDLAIIVSYIGYF